MSVIIIQSYIQFTNMVISQCILNNNFSMTIFLEAVEIRFTDVAILKNLKNPSIQKFSKVLSFLVIVDSNFCF